MHKMTAGMSQFNFVYSSVQLSLTQNVYNDPFVINDYFDLVCDDIESRVRQTGSTMSQCHRVTVLL